MKNPDELIKIILLKEILKQLMDINWKSDEDKQEMFKRINEEFERQLNKLI